MSCPVRRPAWQRPQPWAAILRGWNRGRTRHTLTEAPMNPGFDEAGLAALDKEKASFLIREVLDRANPQAAADER